MGGGGETREQMSRKKSRGVGGECEDIDEREGKRFNSYDLITSNTLALLSGAWDQAAEVNWRIAELL